MSSAGQFSPASRRSSADRSAAILAFTSVGAGVLAIGQLSGLVIVAAGPLFVAAIVQSFIRRLARLESDIDELIRQVNKVLDSTAVFTGRAPGSLPGQ